MTDAVNAPAPEESKLKKKSNLKAWYPMAFFAFAAVAMLVLYFTEHAFRLEADHALSALRAELSNVQAEMLELDKIQAESERSFSLEIDELNKKIGVLEADKMALEKERDQYKEGSWNSQQELEKLKAEVITLRTQAQQAVPAAMPAQEPVLVETPVPQA